MIHDILQLNKTLHLTTNNLIDIEIVRSKSLVLLNINVGYQIFISTGNFILTQLRETLKCNIYSVTIDLREQAEEANDRNCRVSLRLSDITRIHEYIHAIQKIIVSAKKISYAAIMGTSTDERHLHSPFTPHTEGDNKFSYVSPAAELIGGLCNHYYKNIQNFVHYQDTRSGEVAEDTAFHHTEHGNLVNQKGFLKCGTPVEWIYLIEQTLYHPTILYRGDAIIMHTDSYGYMELTQGQVNDLVSYHIEGRDPVTIKEPDLLAKKLHVLYQEYIDNEHLAGLKNDTPPTNGQTTG